MNDQLIELQRWSEEVARDPVSPAFVPLAQAYRRQGRYAAAIGLCLRALAKNPMHLEGHALLAKLYLESGDAERAGDEWSVILRLDPDHFEAHRGLGYFWLERGRLVEARSHLERASTLRPHDIAVQSALSLLTEEVAEGQIFAPLLEDPSCLGILLIDSGGGILAGGIRSGIDGEAEVAAILLGSSLGDAESLLESVGFGRWDRLTVEVNGILLRLVPAGGEARLLMILEGDGSEEEAAQLEARAISLSAEMGVRA